MKGKERKRKVRKVIGRKRNETKVEERRERKGKARKERERKERNGLSGFFKISCPLLWHTYFRHCPLDRRKIIENNSKVAVLRVVKARILQNGCLQGCYGAHFT